MLWPNLLLFNLVRLLRSGGLLLLLSGLSVTGAHGGELTTSTDWQGGKRSQLRLIAGEAEWQGQTRLFAGIEIRLAPNWKTYWRTPGDTGIPPDFDWSGSENLFKAEVLYPVPIRFKDPGGFSIGYKSRVTLPVLLQPIDPLKPIKLKLNAAYAICYDLCVPVSAEHSLVLTHPLEGPFGPVFSMALAEIPQLTGPESEVGVRKVNYLGGDRKILEIEVQGAKPRDDIELFVEGADGLYVPMPKRVIAEEGKGDDVRFQINLAGVDDPDVFQTAKLICTLKVGERPIVQPCNVR